MHDYTCIHSISQLVCGPCTSRVSYVMPTLLKNPKTPLYVLSRRLLDLFKVCPFFVVRVTKRLNDNAIPRIYSVSQIVSVWVVVSISVKARLRCPARNEILNNRQHQNRPTKP